MRRRDYGRGAFPFFRNVPFWYSKNACLSSACVLITIGPHAKFIAEGARQAGFLKKNIRSFDTAEDTLGTLPALIRKGDLVLVKGSRAMYLETIVEELQVQNVNIKMENDNAKS